MLTNSLVESGMSLSEDISMTPDTMLHVEVSTSILDKMFALVIETQLLNLCILQLY